VCIDDAEYATFGFKYACMSNSLTMKTEHPAFPEGEWLACPLLPWKKSRNAGADAGPVLPWLG
jgi:hypothetical protein